MRPECPYCRLEQKTSASRIISFGYFRRKSDKKLIPRFKCKTCLSTYSKASLDPCFKQIKRQFNPDIFKLLSSGVSQRRSAYLLKLNRKTIQRKFIFLGLRAKSALLKYNLNFPRSMLVEFDDLETFEHSKCKPLSVTLAVESKTRRILSFTVSVMPAKGRLVEKSLKKYGVRKDKRSAGRRVLFSELKQFVDESAIIKSDQNPHYIEDVKRFFPKAQHIAIKGKRGAITGQGELKKTQFDPLFSLNHTCAKLRADINRLIRRTWCTTKKKERLEYHIALYSLYHNQSLTAKKRV